MKRGLNGPGNKLRDTPSNRAWMPEVLFQPQETGARNRANAKPIEATPSYSATDMPVFRPLGANDTEGAESQMPKGKKLQPQDWK